MKRLKLSTMLFAVVAISFVFKADSCQQEKSTDQKMKEAQEKVIAQGNSMIGMPGITRFQEKRVLKMIYELRDREKLICYAYIVAEMTGKLIFIGKCEGFGIPYATQYSNPEQIIDEGGTYHYQTLPQAEPNGLYMPASADGTWLLMLDKTGEPHPFYCEPRVIVSPFPLDGSQAADIRPVTNEAPPKITSVETNKTK